MSGSLKPPYECCRPISETNPAMHTLPPRYGEEQCAAAYVDASSVETAERFIAWVIPIQFPGPRGACPSTVGTVHFIGVRGPLNSVRCFVIRSGSKRQAVPEVALNQRIPRRTIRDPTLGKFEHDSLFKHFLAEEERFAKEAEEVKEVGLPLQSPAGRGASHTGDRGHHDRPRRCPPPSQMRSASSSKRLPPQLPPPRRGSQTRGTREPRLPRLPRLPHPSPRPRSSHSC